jgi:DNA invertase Pin-like site-specific DNA recombinase
MSALERIPGEGRKRAKERGVRFGRPRKLTPHQRQEALQRLAAGETQADVASTQQPLLITHSQ